MSDATATALAPFGPYSGYATVEIDEVFYQAEVYVELVSLSRPTEDGTFHLETVTDFYFPDFASWLYTFESIVLSANDYIGDFRANSRMDIIGGTGFFAEAFGKSLPHGDVSFVSFELDVLCKGENLLLNIKWK